MSWNEESLTRLPFFDWDKAKNFYYVAKLGSFSEAAKFLNTSQPSLSRQIAILEGDLGCTLLVRLSRGVKLTRKGEELYTSIENFFLAMKGFTQNTGAMSQNGQKRKIRISTTQPVAAYLLNKHLIDYNQQHPNIIFEVITNSDLMDLTINDVDMAIRPFDAVARGVQQEHFLTFEHKLYASQGYLDTHGEPETAEDLHNKPLIAYPHTNERTHADLNWILKLGMLSGETQEPFYTSDSLECLIYAAQQGLGIVTGFEEMQIVKDSGLKQILRNVQGPLYEEYIIYSDYLKNDDVFQEFKDYILKKFASFRNAKS